MAPDDSHCETGGLCVTDVETICLCFAECAVHLFLIVHGHKLPELFNECDCAPVFVAVFHHPSLYVFSPRPPPLSESLCASSINSLPPFVSLLVVACGERCFGAVQAKDKGPLAYKLTHCVWRACTLTNTFSSVNWPIKSKHPKVLLGGGVEAQPKCVFCGPGTFVVQKINKTIK